MKMSTNFTRVISLSDTKTAQRCALWEIISSFLHKFTRSLFVDDFTIINTRRSEKKLKSCLNVTEQEKPI